MPILFTAGDALAAGLTRDQIRHRLRAGSWQALGRGTYRRANWMPSDIDDQYSVERIDHTHRSVAAALRNPECIVGFESAAVVHYLPLFSPIPSRVTLIAPPGHWYGPRGQLLLRRSALAASDVEQRRVPITTPARTWFDVARTRSLADALTAGDWGLRTHSVSLDQLRSAVHQAGSVRGCRRAAQALALLDAARETPLESGSWAYFVQHSIPLPSLQLELRDRSDAFIGRVDFCWESVGVVGECDGRVKYESRERLYQEKRREDRLRDMGWQVVRWGWADLWGPSLAARLRRVGVG